MSIGVAVVGYGWMGRAHSQAYLRLPHHFPQLLRPELIAVADPEPDRRADAQLRYGFPDAVANWQALLDDPRIQAVSITAPNALHRELGVSCARAGKHIWIEKPVGLVAADAVAVAEAAAGVQTAVGFNYRNAPAVSRARQLIADGAVGTITSVRVQLRSDYAAHPQGALSWRFERELGGPGVLGDLVSHGADLARYLNGDLESVVADTGMFIPRRPRPSGAGSHFALATGEPGPVENEDYLGCLVRFANGAKGYLEASRVAVGDQNNYGFTVYGTQGYLAWDFRRMGELIVSIGQNYADQPSVVSFVGPGDGDFAAFQPGAGIAMSYDDLKVIECARFIESIEAGEPRGATVADAVASARAIDAMLASVASGRWEPVATQ